MDRAVVLTALLALSSLLAGFSTGIALKNLSGEGFASALIVFVDTLSKKTEVSQGVSIVPNIPEQVESTAKTLEQTVRQMTQPPPKPSPAFLMLGIFLTNMRTVALIPMLHSIIPFGMMLQGWRMLGRRHETVITASALVPLILNGFMMGGSLSEYPILAPLLFMELFSLSLMTYIASRAFLSEVRGLERLKTAYRGVSGIIVYCLISMALASSIETILIGVGYGG